MKEEKTMTKYTPGPWFMDYDHAWDIRAGKASDSYLIAGLGPSDQSNANARLIAAAPDMAEALQTVATRIRIVASWEGNIPCSQLSAELGLDDVRAALQKAGLL